MKKAKKGFTLAELLIVVAIVAVLTAIAVPLFVGALNDADTKVQSANIRAVRATAVTKILEDQQLTVKKFGDNAGNGWDVHAVVDASGAITSMDIKAATATTLTESGTATKQGDGSYKVELRVTELSATTITTTGDYPS